MNRAILIAFVLLCGLYTSLAQSFYDMGTIQTIELFFPSPDWDFQLDTAKAGEDKHVLATSCILNGEMYDSVGVKYKGYSAYHPDNAKNPFHIELTTTIPTQDIQGSNDIKFGNGFGDPSMIREVLSYEILRNYMHAPRSNFAKVFVNGEFWGLFSSNEHIGKKFTTRHFYSNHQALFECNPASSATDAPDLNYLGPNPSPYFDLYNLRSDFLTDWQELIYLCDTLQNTPQALDQILDIDRAIWMLAFNSVVVNLDSYTGANRQNYYLYRDDNGRFNPISWNLNQSFGSFSLLTDGQSLDTTALAQLPPGANNNSAQHPLIQVLWNNPVYQRMWVAHARTILEEIFESGWYLNRAQELQELIEADVLADDNKFFSDDQFYNSLDTHIPDGSGGFIPGLEKLMEARIDFLKNTPAFIATAPTLSDITLSEPQPVVFETIWITATIEEANEAWLGSRHASLAAFTKAPMYDDGQHNDGAAGDKIFGAELTLQSARTEYYIYAENSEAGAFSPKRAEHEFYLIEATVPDIQSGEVVINEFVPDNATGTTDPNGQYEDWIELYNNTSSPVSLAGLHLSDKADLDTKWKFPDWAVIPGNEYLIVWCDEDNGQSGLHANFKLDKEGGLVQLAYSENQILEGVGYIAQNKDESVARCINGTGGFLPHIFPTFAAFNTCVPASLKDPVTLRPIVAIYPNPVAEWLHLSMDSALETIELFDFSGKRLFSRETAYAHEVHIDIRPYAPGLYALRLNGKWTETLLINR